MHKVLGSGITVVATQFYALLEWKDNHIEKFLFFCKEYGVEPSINKMDMPTYRALLQFANLD